MNDPIHILSLGAGVQSSTLALMAARGEIGPMPKYAVFADTKNESVETYKWLDWLETQLPFPIHRVTAGDLAEAATRRRINQKTGNAYYANLIPAYAKNTDGTTGITGRTCTFHFKIKPIVKFLRQSCDIKRGQKSVGVIQWIGVSLDEVSRMKPSREAWIKNRFPLIEKEMTRHDCLRWLHANQMPTPPRSACTFCPFKSDHEWRNLNKQELAGAGDFERKLQQLHASISTKGKRQGIPFLHNSFVPIEQIDFSEDEKQGNLHFHNECEGMCGV